MSPETPENRAGLNENHVRRLRKELAENAAELGSNDVPGRDEFRLIVRGMPVFDVMDLNVTPA